MARWFTGHARPFRCRFFQNDVLLYESMRAAHRAIDAMEEAIKDYDLAMTFHPDFIVTRIEVAEMGVNLELDPPG